MKRVVLGFVAASMVLATASFAQPAPKAQIAGQPEWVALMKKQSEARKELATQQSAERDAFLKDHPAMAAVVAEQVKRAKERAAQRKAEGK